MSDEVIHVPLGGQVPQVPSESLEDQKTREESERAAVIGILSEVEEALVVALEKLPDSPFSVVKGARSHLQYAKGQIAHQKYVAS